MSAAVVPAVVEEPASVEVDIQDVAAAAVGSPAVHPLMGPHSQDLLVDMAGSHQLDSLDCLEVGNHLVRSTEAEQLPLCKSTKKYSK